MPLSCAELPVSVAELALNYYVLNRCLTLCHHTDVPLTTLFRVIYVLGSEHRIDTCQRHCEQSARISFIPYCYLEMRITHLVVPCKLIAE